MPQGPIFPWSATVRYGLMCLGVLQRHQLLGYLTCIVVVSISFTKAREGLFLTLKIIRISLWHQLQLPEVSSFLFPNLLPAASECRAMYLLGACCVPFFRVFSQLVVRTPLYGWGYSLYKEESEARRGCLRSPSTKAEGGCQTKISNFMISNLCRFFFP